MIMTLGVGYYGCNEIAKEVEEPYGTPAGERRTGFWTVALWAWSKTSLPSGISETLRLLSPRLEAGEFCFRG